MHSGSRVRVLRVELWGWLGGLALVLASCANPVAPSGGPRDDTPPTVLGTQPMRDTVNVSTDTEALRIEFSEYIERTTLPGALSVTPTFEQRPPVEWSGRTAEIEFPSPLRDSTTYIFTIDTNLSDARGVSLNSPLTVAFSTGPRINRGQIEGQVVGARMGAAKPQVDVYAYALAPGATEPPRPLPDRPSYRTQTSEEGTFAFDYMREGRYYVLALRDNNRNRQPDASEPAAVPPRPALQADSGAAPVPVPWLLAARDTTPPQPQQVRAVSRQRIRVNFNEPVQLQRRTAADWALRDSTTGAQVAVRGVHGALDRPSAVVVRTAPMAERGHRLALRRGVVTDTLGQPLAPDTVRFRAAARDDTSQTRFRRFLPADLAQDSTGAHPLLPGVRPAVRFNQAPDSTVLRAGIQARDTAGAPRDFSLLSEDGTAYRLRFDPPLAPGEFVDVTVDGEAVARPDTTYRRRFRRVTRRALGALEGRIRVADTLRRGPARPQRDSASRPASPAAPRATRPPDTTAAVGRRDLLLPSGPVAVELTAEASSLPVPPRRVTTPPGSTFVFDELPDGQYRFRAYLDRNGNGRWDAGRLQPYVPAEPVTWRREPVQARPRWTTELPTPLRIPRLVPGPSRPAPDTTRAPPAAPR